MKKLLLPVFLIIFHLSYAQKIIKIKRASRHSIHVFGDNFEGLIFKKGIVFKSGYAPFSLYGIENKSFTPALEEIELTETILDQDLKNMSDSSGRNYERIFNNLDLFIRQYFGYINEQGEKIIFINCFYKLNNVYYDRKYWLQDLVAVWDGGQAFWHVRINLSTGKLFAFYVNGF